MRTYIIPRISVIKAIKPEENVGKLLKIGGIPSPIQHFHCCHNHCCYALGRYLLRRLRKYSCSRQGCRFWSASKLKFKYKFARPIFCRSWGPRLRSRPKFASDQTFQTKIISDQTFQTEIISDQTFQTEIISDQTFQTEWVLIRLSRPKEFWLDHLQAMVQTQIQTIAQTLIRLWSNLISDTSSLWSDSVETNSPADHPDQKQSKSPSSALPSFNHIT